MKRLPVQRFNLSTNYVAKPKRIAAGDESWDEMVPPQSLRAVAGC